MDIIKNLTQAISNFIANKKLDEVQDIIINQPNEIDRAADIVEEALNGFFGKFKGKNIHPMALRIFTLIRTVLNRLEARMRENEL